MSFLLLSVLTLLSPQAAPDPHAPRTLPDGRVLYPPTLVSSPEPSCPAKHSFFQQRRRVEIYLIVPENGVPRGVKVVRSGGDNYDKEALAAVEQYRFRPATIADKAVVVDLYVDVNFLC